MSKTFYILTSCIVTIALAAVLLKPHLKSIHTDSNIGVCTDRKPTWERGEIIRNPAISVHEPDTMKPRFEKIYAVQMIKDSDDFSVCFYDRLEEVDGMILSSSAHGFGCINTRSEWIDEKDKAKGLITFWWPMKGTDRSERKRYIILGEDVELLEKLHHFINSPPAEQL